MRADQEWEFALKDNNWVTLLASILSVFLSAWVTQWLWDWKCVGIFGAPRLGYWDAFWLIMLVRAVRGSPVYSLINYKIKPADEE